MRLYAKEGSSTDNAEEGNGMSRVRGGLLQRKKEVWAGQRISNRDELTGCQLRPLVDVDRFSE